jgi:hypothetical protein
MSQPRKVAQAFEHYASWTGTVTSGSSTQIAFVPIDAGAAASGPPVGASGAAKPVLIGHEILISNPGSNALLVTPATVQSGGATAAGGDAYNAWPPAGSNQKPMWVDPTTFPAVTATNSIVVPAGAIAYPIRVRAVGITIKAASGDVTPSVAAYGPLSLLS